MTQPQYTNVEQGCLQPRYHGHRAVSIPLVTNPWEGCTRKQRRLAQEIGHVLDVKCIENIEL